MDMKELQKLVFDVPFSMYRNDPVAFIRDVIFKNNSDKMLKMTESVEKIINIFHDERFIVGLHSRGVGMTTINAAFFLWKSIFHEKSSNVYIDVSYAITCNFLDVIEKMYKELPDIYKIGFHKITNCQYKFGNGSHISTSTSSISLRGKHFDLICIENMNLLSNAEQNSLLVICLNDLNYQGELILLGGYLVRDTEFSNLYKGAKEDKNNFSSFEITWSAVAGRNLEWKSNMIKDIGESAFNREYECKNV